MAAFTVFGAAGWIGSALVRRLQRNGHVVQAATREQWPGAGEQLGHVIFAIGLTADFRGRPMQTATAHVGKLLEVLERYRWQSLLYLSSTRVYRGAEHGAENARLTVDPTNADDVYNITKLAGESVCLSLADPHVRVARLSNVIGPGDRSENFLTAVLTEARANGHVTIRTSPQSQKDYIGLDDVCQLLEAVALKGSERLYNVASGRNVANLDIANLIVGMLGADVTFAENAVANIFPPIVVERIRREFPFAPSTFEQLLREIIDSDYCPPARQRA